MTEDQIKAIAEKIADNNYKHYGDDKAVELMAAEYESVISQLLQDYCIVEREKVEHEMISANQNIDLFRLYPQVVLTNEGIKKVLTRLFGTSMFNQNEE